MSGGVPASPHTAAGVLAGRTLVVTRPAEQAEALCARIRALGGTAVKFPVLAIGPAPDRAALERVLDRLEGFDLAFFVSPNAVHYTMACLRARRSWPEQVRVATVGKGSEKVLKSYGFSAVIAPEHGFDSEAVLALEEFSAAAMRGRRVLILRGDGGRDLLGQTLRTYGAEVEYASCYRRYCPELDPAPVLEPAARGELDGVLLTSSEGVGNFAALVGAAGKALLEDVPMFTSHARIAAHARDAGFARIIETAPGDDGLLHALQRHFG